MGLEYEKKTFLYRDKAYDNITRIGNCKHILQNLNFF